MNDKQTEGEKKLNPKQNAGCLSSATFMWILPVLKKSKHHFGSLDALYNPLREDSSQLMGNKMQRAWVQEVYESKRSKRKPSLIRMFFGLYIWKLILSVVMIFMVEFVFRLLTPLCLIQFISYFDRKSRENVSDEMFYLSTAGLILSPFLTVFINHGYHFKVFHIGMKLRVAISSLIYRKVLSLSKAEMLEISTGHIVNLLANDAGRFDFIVSFFYDVWIGPLQIIVIAYLLWSIIGISCLVGIFLIILSIPLTVCICKIISLMRSKTALRTDDRVRIMSEIIVGIQVIKMYVWEKPFEKVVEVIRMKEVAVIKYMSYIKGTLASFPMFHTRTATFITLVTYVFLGNKVTSSKAFVLTSFFNVLQLTVADYFPLSSIQVSEFLISVKRIEEFLLSGTGVIKSSDPSLMTPFKPFKKILTKRNLITVNLRSNPELEISNLNAKWTAGGKNVLNDISLNLKPGDLTAIVGTVGAGKTTLFYAILKEIIIDSGILHVRGKVSYASQEPWLFPASIKQNILFGEEYNKERFEEVIKACALDKDFEGFAHRERSLVGERGVTLSGGQKARINLARAIYKDADIYLLDDPLSAVDTHVQKHLFERCISGFLKDKAVLLITHQVQYLKDVKEIIILENGSIKFKGNYDDIQNCGIDVSAYIKKSEYEESSGVLTATKHEEETSPFKIITEKEDDEQMTLEDFNKKKNMRTFSSYFKQGGNICILAMLAIIFFGAQVAASLGDYWMSYWVNLEDHVYISNSTEPSDSIFDIFHFYPSRNICLIVFAILISANIILSILRSTFFFSICMRISQKLHNKMFKAVSRSPMHFFNNNPSGRILNRFSKDIGNIDEILPSSMISCFQIFLSALGVFSVVATTNLWLLIPTCAMLALFYLMRQFFLIASNLIKRAEGAARSPVYTHLNSSLQGLTTIHALQAEPALTKEFDAHQDKHSAAWFSFISAGRANALWLDIVCAIYNALVTLSFIYINPNAFGGNVGLAITQTSALTSNLQWGMRQSAEVENHMTSVERILEYTRLEEEKPFESEPENKPHPHWPTKGKIVFKNVYLRYQLNGPWILYDLSFHILPSQKVGVVGRTGAGKSSLIAALFRLFEVNGTIEIDDLDTSKVGFWELRCKISVIPQDPALFSGSLRYNLDPFDQVLDDALWQALEEVELKEFVMNQKEGLNMPINEGGSNLSIGQRQLISLARAIVKNNRILILDEPTANVDSRTDSLIQQTIRRKFKDCTILTIAHRLNSIMDSDVVMVMDYGKLVEFGHPKILLDNKSGHFYELVEQAGCFQELHAIASQHFRVGDGGGSS